MSKGPYRLVHTQLSSDTVVVLEELLAEAKKGHIVGISFEAMYSGRRFVVDTAGEARRNPTWTMGMLVAHMFQLAKRVNE